MRWQVAAAKKMKKTRAKKATRKPRRVDPVWTRAVADIVASSVARAHVLGEDVRAKTNDLAHSLVAAIPRAQRVMALQGHSPNQTCCRCYAYALLQIDAHDAALVYRLPPQSILFYSVTRFDAWMDNRS